MLQITEMSSCSHRILTKEIMDWWKNETKLDEQKWHDLEWHFFSCSQRKQKNWFSNDFSWIQACTWLAILFIASRTGCITEINDCTYRRLRSCDGMQQMHPTIMQRNLREKKKTYIYCNLLCRQQLVASKKYYLYVCFGAWNICFVFLVSPLFFQKKNQKTKSIIWIEVARYIEKDEDLHCECLALNRVTYVLNTKYRNLLHKHFVYVLDLYLYRIVEFEWNGLAVSSRNEKQILGILRNLK